ncbi:hypothetical protein GLOIN_2v1780731 [Rhizophagus clarus]|uniref:F-box domain-containing protein n=1 Tax=Rhizophagus clarus TaxID=94130 RepID=A0A8H3L8P8_9GLOM|nr:hypothetical protein GLOIN_2v1780731 [Rhizophagus clarus]
MAKLVHDVLLLIFIKLKSCPTTLYSCVLVSKMWCDAAVRILWESMSNESNPTVRAEESRKKLYNIISHFLPNGPNEILQKNNIILPLKRFPRLTYNYMEYFTNITSIWIDDMLNLLIDDDSIFSNCKRKLLELEIYKLILNKCNNVKDFNWITDIQLYLCPKSDDFFSKLQSLELNQEFVTSVILLSLPVFCHSIKNLKLHLYQDCSDLSLFIMMQQNLQSLYLNFDNEDEHYEQYPLLSDAIMKKGFKLKEITLTPLVALIKPVFFPSLINIQYLILNNDNGELDEHVNWKVWKYNLRLASFPRLQYLETSYLPSSIETLIIKKSSMNLLEINIRYPLESQNYPIENMQLIKAISMCSNITSLIMDVDSNNVREIISILQNCSKLEKLYFTTKIKITPNGDELLNIMSDVSPAALREFSFGENWNLSLNGLKSFFETWKNKICFKLNLLIIMINLFILGPRIMIN